MFAIFVNNFRSMDIDLLSRMVKELILDSDEVSLPGVGSFVTELIPATFSDQGYTINLGEQLLKVIRKL